MKFTILKVSLGALTERVEKFKRKVAKYGNASVIYEVGEPFRCWEETSPLFGKTVVEVNVEGQYQVPGYTFVASLEWQDNLHRNLICRAPGVEELPAKYLTLSQCEHCGQNRYRKYTIVLRNTTTGDYIQVGKSCAKDYVKQDISDYAAYLEWWSKLADQVNDLNCAGLSISPTSYDMRYVLEQTCAEVRTRGFISVSAAAEKGTSSTAARIRAMLSEEKDMHGNLIVPEYVITDGDKALATKVEQWANSLADDSSYNMNVHTLYAQSYIELDYRLNIFVSAVGTFVRKLTEGEAAANNKSQFVGKVGDKIQFIATPEAICSFDTVYGTTHIYKFNVEDNVFIWKTSKFLCCDYRYEVSGTIKAHSAFKGIRQTEITRCKVSTIED